MIRRVAPAAFALTLAVSSAAAQDVGRVTTIPLPRGAHAEAALLADVDGDGADDLVVATGRGGARASRALLVHRRRTGAVAFAPEADARLRLTGDVVAFAAADVDPAPGAEIVLLTATGAWGWLTGEGGDTRPRRLVSADFLWQVPHPRETFVWDHGVQDLDGDGLPDLLLPESGGYRVAFQRRGAEGGSGFATESLLSIPEDAAAVEGRAMGRDERRRRGNSLRVRIGLDQGGELDDADLLNIAEGVPAPMLADFDGDGLRDVMAQTPDALLVWLQRRGGSFSTAPDRVLSIPVEADRGRRLDVSYSAHTADLDGNGRADCLIVAGDRRSEEVRTQVLVYLQGVGKGKAQKTDDHPLFGPEGVPQSALFLAGFVGGPQVVDVDGDGRPDLALGALRVDTLDVLRAAGSGRLDVQLVVHRGGAGGLSRQPVLDHTLSLPAETTRRGRREIVVRFLADVTGDGVRELLVRPDPDVLRLSLVRRTGGGLSVVDLPLFETHVHEDAELVLHEPRGRPPEVLVLEEAQILHVRFR